DGIVPCEMKRPASDFAFAALMASAAMFVGTVGNVARADTLGDVKRRGELVFGADAQGGEPYVYEDPADPSHRLVGFEVDIGAAIARRLGVRSRFSQADWST